MNEQLAMIAEKLGESNLKGNLESNLVKLQHEKVSLLNKLEDEIDPVGIYSFSGEISYTRRAKTYLIANKLDEKYVIKISELEEGKVSRLGLWVELGKVRMARLEDELENIQNRISKKRDSLSELQLNEILYDVPCSDKAIKWHQMALGEPEIELVARQEVLFHDWKENGF